MDLAWAWLELAQEGGRVCSEQPLGFPANVCVWILGTSQLSLEGGGWRRRMLNGDKQEGERAQVNK